MPSNTDNPEVKEKNKTEKVRSNRYNADVNNILNVIGQFLGSSSLPSANSSDSGIKKKKNMASLTKKRPIHLNSENPSPNKNASSSQEQTTLKEEQVDKSNSQPGFTSSGGNTLPEENLDNKDIVRMDLISDIVKEKDLENRMESLDI
jgi:hypothetical protein